MSMRGGAQSSEMKTFLDEASEPPEELHLNHDEVCWEFYTGRHFGVRELVPGVERHHETRLKLNALGGELLWTLNHEVVFSTALTGRPRRKACFSQYCWKRCAVGTAEEYDVATSKQEWEFALMKGDLYGLQSSETRETIVLCPWNNTEYLNVAAYLEAFWGFIWPTVCHGNLPPHDEWTSNLHVGLKEFIDHAISVLGRTHLKPTTECLRGVVTYPTGDSTQGRFKMTLMDLQNEHYTVAVREAMMNLILGRSDKNVQVGDVVEMLLSISFGVKDSMLDWWINYPWHVVYSALRCMACQDWKRPHACPVCGALARNNGGTYDAWAYLRGCLTHLNTAPKCIGTLLLEDPLNARGNSLIPLGATLLTELSPEKQARDWLPPMTILYMAPGGHRQWPVSIKPMMDRLSWIVLRTRSLALMRLHEALLTRPNWKPYYRQGPRIDSVPAVPYKFLDIGTQMGEYQLEELTLKKDDKDNILHPRYTRSGIPPVDTFHSVVQGRVGNQHDIIQQWCTVKAWFESSPTCDFWVVDESKYRWGLPVLVPTCPRKLFMQGPRLKYIDIVTDTLHASSSDLITWNTLVLMKLKWLDRIPRQWVDITVNSLEAWETRDQLSQFHADTRRGYARVTPVALSHIGVPGSRTLPVNGLGVYDDFEVCDKFSDYIWATWTTMTAQPMQIDSALQALLNPSGRPPSGQPGVHYDLGVPINVNAADQPTGSNECASGVAAPFPDSVEDVSMDSGADKRSRESPDSTLKPEGKSLKTSETATAPTTTDTNEMSTADSVKPSNVTKRPKTVSEAKSLMREVHQRMPAWKAEKLLETCKVDQVDLAALGEATGILFASQDMLKEAVLHLDRIRKEKAGKEDADLDAPETSDTHSSESQDQDESEGKRSDDQKEKNTNAAPSRDATAVPSAIGDSGGASNQDSKSSSKTQGDTSGQQDATASKSGSVQKKKQESASETHKEWFSRVTREGQEVLWPPTGSDKCPTLLTGVQPSDHVCASL